MMWPWKKKRLEESWDWPHVFWVNIFGWWGEEARSETGRRWLPRLRNGCLAHLVVMSGALVVAICEKLAMGDIMTNMFTVFAAGPGIVGFFKTIQIVRHRAPLKSVMDQLDDLLKEVDSPHSELIMRRGLRRAWIVFTISLTTGSCITLHWLSRPLLIAAFFGEKSRIVDTWPVFIETWAHFALSYLFQSPGVIFLGHAFYIFDNMYFCMSELILAHLDILKSKLETLKLSDQDKSSQLVSCVRYHTNILRICHTLREASTPVIIWQCINTVVMACSGVFIVTMVDGINANILLNLGEIILIITVTLYFYCWYSNEMTFQLSNVLDSGYMSDWCDGTEGDKRSLHILMTKAVTPFYFGGILQINLSTFINVLKTTFSYYNFLIAVNSTEN